MLNILYIICSVGAHALWTSKKCLSHFKTFTDFQDRKSTKQGKVHCSKTQHGAPRESGSSKSKTTTESLRSSIHYTHETF